MKIAVIQTGGKQYLISEGDKIKIEKIKGEVGSKIEFDKILLFSDEKKTEIGQPYIEKAKVEGEIIKTGRARKVIVFKYHRKTRYRKKNTHRQWFSEISIKKINF
jgi:large subunit ribosomal protein L21